jgi:K(+)-stimulated pyrophosphate-energized sodium pump
MFLRLRSVALAALLLVAATPAFAAQPPDVSQAPAGQTQAAPVRHGGGEANLILPDLGSVTFQGINGRTLLMGGLVVSLMGLGFGLVIYTRLKNLPVHRSMLEISELIYETCKTYLITQGKFILLLWVFIGVISAV